MTTKKPPPQKKKPVSLLLTHEREVGAAEFKARCLEIMDEVERLGAEITITKHRRPVARLVPIRSQHERFCGSLAGTVLEMGDLLAPIDVEWEHDAPNLA